MYNMDKNKISIGSTYELKTEVEAGYGGPDTVTFPEGLFVECIEIREGDALFVNEIGAGFYAQKDEIDELMEIVDDNDFSWNRK